MRCSINCFHVSENMSGNKTAVPESGAQEDQTAEQNIRRSFSDTPWRQIKMLFLDWAFWIEGWLGSWGLCDVMGLEKTITALVFIVIRATGQGADFITNLTAGPRTEAALLKGLIDLYTNGVAENPRAEPIRRLTNHLIGLYWYAMFMEGKQVDSGSIICTAASHGMRQMVLGQMPWMADLSAMDRQWERTPIAWLQISSTTRHIRSTPDKTFAGPTPVSTDHKPF